MMAANAHGANLKDIIIQSPVDGGIDYSASHAYKWSFNIWGPDTKITTNTHKQRADGTGYGLLRTNDYYAIDANLAFDLDKNLPVYPVADGTVIGWFGVNSDGATQVTNYDGRKNYGAVLIEHNINGVIFYSGYMHMTGTMPELNTFVSKTTPIGYVSNTQKDFTVPAHLHFSLYDKAVLKIPEIKNSKGKITQNAKNINYLKSFDYKKYNETSDHSNLGLKRINTPSKTNYSLKTGGVSTISLKGYYETTENSFNADKTAKVFNMSNLDIDWFNRFAWTSNNKAVCTVDLSGNITAKKEGSATINLDYSGYRQQFTVTVKNK